MPRTLACIHVYKTCIRDLYKGALSHEHLVDVQEDVTALHDHPLYRQVLPDVLGLRHLGGDDYT